MEANREVKSLTSRFRNLAPATLYEISNLEGVSRDFVYKATEPRTDQS